MSLLLQALQKAARNREQAGAQAGDPPPEAPRDNRSMLELEPGEFEPGRVAGPEAPAPDQAFPPLPGGASSLTLEGTEPAAGAPARPTYVDRIDEPTPQQAATLMRAAAMAREPRFDALDWAREHPVYIFAASAFLFLAGYGGYVYLAISQPALLNGGLFGKPAPGAPVGPLSVAPRPPAAPTSAAAAPTAPPLLPDITASPPPAAATAPGATAATGAVTAPTPPAPAPARTTVAAKQPPGARTESVPAAARPAAEPAQRTVQADAVPQSPATQAVAQPTPDIPVIPVPRRSSRKTAAAGGREAANGRLEVRTSTGAAAIEAQLGEAYAASRKGDAQAAQAAYERVLTADGRNVDAMLGLASLAWQGGNNEQASELYYRVLQSDPQNAAAQAGLIGLVGRVDPVASETRLKQLITREPTGALYFALGNLYSAQGQWAPAQSAYFRSVEADPGNPDYGFNLAVALEHIGQQKSALAQYRKALELSFARGGAGFDQKQVIARIGQLSLAVE